MKLGFIAKHRSVWPVAWLCEALGVSKSGLHAWLKRGPCVRSREDDVIMPAVRTSFVASARTYGVGLLDEPFRKRVGQRRHGKLLLVDDNRTDRSKGLRTRDAARADVFDYIERFYSTIRRHSTIGYLKPG